MKNHKASQKSWLSALTFRVSVLVVGVMIAFSSAGHEIAAAPQGGTPSITIGDASIIEGNAFLGPRMVFPVTLSGSSSNTVAVNYATSDGSAISSAVGSTFSNAVFHEILDNTVADPYPSNITVPAVGNSITKVTASIFNYSHLWPGDVDMLLVGPGGQSVILMSDLGESDNPVSGLNITFDDNGSNMPAVPTSGTFKPKNIDGSEPTVFGGPDVYPSPAPSAPYGTTLSAFNGTSPAGTWKLFIVDDSLADSGTIVGGWSLTITTQGGDFVATSGTLTFAPGVTRKTFVVPIHGDGLPESNETFTVNLSGAANATIADGQAIGTIIDDDGANPPAGSGPADLVIDFGSNGLWSRLNSTTWEQIHTLNASYVATGDVDGNGQSDVIMDFPTCGCGVWVRLNRGPWQQIHPLDVVNLIAADVDGNGQADVVLNFGIYGVWAFVNRTTWVQVHSGNPSTILSGDLDGDGQQEIIMNFTSGGIWKWSYSQGLTQIHPLTAALLALGNLDGVGPDELLIAFPTYGLYSLSASGWTFLHPLTPSKMIVADIDNTGKGDIIVDFQGYGVWAFRDQTTWTAIHPLDVGMIDTADLNNDGKPDLLMTFPGYGLWARIDDAAWVSIHPQDPEQVAVGGLD